MSTDSAIIVTEGLGKTFGSIEALSGIDLAVEPGTVVALLGPNGAGKTTVVRILTTLLKPTTGKAWVAGFDVVTQAAQLRGVIGLAGQYAAVDEILTGMENLEMVGRLYGLRAGLARRRADEILELFDLTDAAHRMVKTYSGGMLRRLDLGGSLVGRPRVLFLDEPTTGLDLRARLGLWDFIDKLVDEGTTLLLTTQYLEEADHLADAIEVIDRGEIIASGTSQELKQLIGGDVLDFQVAVRSELGAAAEAVKNIGTEAPTIDEESGRVRLPVANPVGVITEAVRSLDRQQIKLRDLAITRPTLDDVFLTLTGKEIEREDDAAELGTSLTEGRET
ncbi:MAG: ATP-binding cassette domain-containing protein [Acidobacteria bacterium]|nr:ATP-binding cassette domain-containing protein [Acidobacteriota bacterium]